MKKIIVCKLSGKAFDGCNTKVCRETEKDNETQRNRISKECVAENQNSTASSCLFPSDNCWPPPLITRAKAKRLLRQLTRSKDTTSAADHAGGTAHYTHIHTAARGDSVNGTVHTYVVYMEEAHTAVYVRVLSSRSRRRSRRTELCSGATT
jgi:hypothetical protein